MTLIFLKNSRVVRQVSESQPQRLNQVLMLKNWQTLRLQFKIQINQIPVVKMVLLPIIRSLMRGERAHRQMFRIRNILLNRKNLKMPRTIRKMTRLRLIRMRGHRAQLLSQMKIARVMIINSRLFNL